MQAEISAADYTGQSEPIQAEPDDASLMQRVQNGDRTAYALLVQRHGGRFRALAENTGLDRAAAEDVLQEVFLTIWQKADSFDPTRARFTTWLHRIVLNRAIDARRKRREDALPEHYDAPDLRMQTDASIELQHIKRSVHQRLDMLNHKQRRAIVLTSLQELSNKDAAEIMQMNIKAFESLLLRAKRKFADIMRKNPIDIHPPHSIGDRP